MWTKMAYMGRMLLGMLLLDVLITAGGETDS